MFELRDSGLFYTPTTDSEPKFLCGPIQPDIRNTIEEMILKSHLCNKAALTVDECALYTGMAKSYIYKLTHEGIIPLAKPNGKKIFFDRLELDEWLLGNKIKGDICDSDFIKKKLNHSTRKHL